MRHRTAIPMSDGPSSKRSPWLWLIKGRDSGRARMQRYVAWRRFLRDLLVWVYRSLMTRDSLQTTPPLVCTSVRQAPRIQSRSSTSSIPRIILTEGLLPRSTEPRQWGSRLAADILSCSPTRRTRTHISNKAICLAILVRSPRAVHRLICNCIHNLCTQMPAPTEVPSRDRPR